MTKIKQVFGLQAALDLKIGVAASSTIGYIPEWKSDTGDALDQGYEVLSEIEEGNKSGKKLANVQAIKDYIDLIVSGLAGLVFKDVLHLTSTAGDVEFPAGDPGDLYIIGTGGKLGTAGSSTDLEQGWWLICKAESLGGGYADCVDEWEIIEMDYCTGLQKELTGNVKNGSGPALSVEENNTYLVASISAFDPAPFTGVIPVCTINGISLDYTTGEVNLTERPNSPGIFWLSATTGSMRLYIRLPYTFGSNDWIEIKYSTI